VSDAFGRPATSVWTSKSIGAVARHRVVEIAKAERPAGTEEIDTVLRGEDGDHEHSRRDNERDPTARVIERRLGAEAVPEELLN
jgi:hypothetical protein